MMNAFMIIPVTITKTMKPTATWVSAISGSLKPVDTEITQ